MDQPVAATGMEFHDSSLADEARRRRVGLVNLLRHLREHWLFSKCSGCAETPDARDRPRASRDVICRASGDGLLFALHLI